MENIINLNSKTPGYVEVIAPRNYLRIIETGAKFLALLGEVLEVVDFDPRTNELTVNTGNGQATISAFACANI